LPSSAGHPWTRAYRPARDIFIRFRAWPKTSPDFAFEKACAEDEQASGERIGIQFLPAHLRQSVDALSQIDRFDGYQDAHLRRYLNHADSHNTRLSPAKSGGALPFH
jgi:hypothetical protein